MSPVVNGSVAGSRFRHWIVWLLVFSVLDHFKQLSPRRFLVVPFTPRTVPTTEEATSSFGLSVSNTLPPGFLHLPVSPCSLGHPTAGSCCKKPLWAGLQCSAHFSSGDSPWALWAGCVWELKGSCSCPGGKPGQLLCGAEMRCPWGISEVWTQLKQRWAGLGAQEQYSKCSFFSSLFFSF